MTLKLYYDLMSQPSRALYILLKAAKVPFEAVPVALRNGEHMTEEFAKVNRLQKVPVIDHNGFKLSESVAIVKYLHAEKLLPEEFFPSDSKAQAKVNEYLAWQHIGIRAPCALYFQLLVIRPMLTGKPATEDNIRKQTNRTVEGLDTFEDKWLGAGNKYLVGDHLTVADIFGCCEIEQPRMAGYDPKVGRSLLAAWMERVRNELNPHYDEAHAILNKIANKQTKVKLGSNL